jgi:hypothetical protein
MSEMGPLSHEMAVIQGRIWLWSASHRPRGADREEVDEHGALCSAKNPAQRPKGEARARQIGRSRGERARGRDGTATCGAVNEALSYRVTETPFGREVEREVLTGRVVEEVSRRLFNTGKFPQYDSFTVTRVASESLSLGDCRESCVFIGLLVLVGMRYW